MANEMFAGPQNNWFGQGSQAAYDQALATSPGYGGASQTNVAYTPGAASGTLGFNPSYVQNANGTWGYNGTSQNPGAVVGGATEAAAQAAWFAAHPEYAAEQTDPAVLAAGGPSGGNMTGLGGNAPPPPPNFTPSTIASQFPNGIPQLNPAQVTGIPQVGNIPQVQNQNVNASPFAIENAMGGPGAYSPQSAISAMQAYLLPQFQQQDAATQFGLASAGIVGGPTAAALGNLGQQQQTTLANDIIPLIQAKQQLQQGALTTGFGNNLTAQQSNQGANMQSQLANQGANMQSQLANQGATLQGSQFNVSQANTAQAQNIQNLLQTGQIDAQTYNNMMQYIASLQNQDYLGQLGAATSVAGAGMGAQTSAFQPNYQQPAPVNLSGAATAFAPPPNYNTAQTQPAAQNPGTSPGYFG